jgi:biopolymer transport protein ExbB/TolQ
MAIAMAHSIVGPISVFIAGFCAIWFVQLMVSKDFFMPRHFIRPNLFGRAFPYCWVIGIVFTTIFVGWRVCLFLKVELFSSTTTSPPLASVVWASLGVPAKAVVIILFIMSIWSLAVIIDRAIYFSAVRKQSREFAPKVAGALREGKLDEAVKVADRYKKSHLADVLTAGLEEFRSYGNGDAITEDQIESSKRALERAEAIVDAKLKRRLGGLVVIGSTAPFIGLFGTVVSILNAFRQIGIGAIAGGISEALATSAFGLLVAIPAVMLFNYFTNKVETFDVEMDNSSSELVDYFIKQSARGGKSK